MSRCSMLLVRLQDGGGARYCDENAGLCVCTRRYLRNDTTEPNPMFSHVACGRGSVLVWRCCDTLCRPTSGFVDDVIFSRSGPYMMSRLHAHNFTTVPRRPKVTKEH